MNNRLPFLAVILWMLAVIPAVAQFEEDQLYREAEKRFRNGHFLLADSLYEKHIEQFPASRYRGEALFRRGMIQYRLENYDAALTLFDRVERRFEGTPSYSEVSYWKGRVLYRRGDFAGASEQFLRYISRTGKKMHEKQALIYRGAGLIKLDRYAEARPVLEEALSFLPETGSLTPEDAFLAVSLLSVYVRTGDYDTVLKATADLSPERFPGNYRPTVMVYAAEALFYRGQRESAEEMYRAILQEGSTLNIDVIAFKRLFEIYMNRGALDRLQAVLHQAELELASRVDVLAELWTLIGIQYFNAGEYSLSESYLARVWEMKERVPVSDRVPVYLSEIARERGEVGEAEEILTHALKGLFPDSESVLSRLASVNMELGNWETAAEQFETLAGRWPDSGNITRYIYSRALALEKTGRLDDAYRLLTELTASGRTGQSLGKILRLKSIVEIRLSLYGDAVSTLRQYIPLAPGELTARFDLLRLFFINQKYDLVVTEVQELYDEYPGLSTKHPREHVLFRYLHGLSTIPGKEYSRAAGILEEIEKQAGEHVPQIHPYILFYIGWARYQNSEFRQAGDVLSRFIDMYPDHALWDRALYVAGWSSYTRENYGEAADLFSRFFREEIGPEFQSRGIFMYGKSRFHLGEYEDAAFAFQYLFQNFSESEYADDSLYEYAEVLRERGEIEESLRVFRQLYETYPESRLAEEGMYKRGEINFQQENYVAARKAFFEYRVQFPEGTLQDAALYWSGLAFKRSGEPFGAVLMWERLTENYPRSSFRPDAMAETAEIYAESGDYAKAVQIYNRLINLYPLEAVSVKAETERDRLVNLMQGMSSREAELTAVIAREGGAATERGREALLQLSRLFIYRGVDPRESQRAFDMLQMVLDYGSEDMESAARATYLLGEYYSRRNELKKAGDTFLRAAIMYPQNRDMMASAMYRAAEMSKRSGNTEEVRNLVQRLENNFPGSQWVIEGRKLIEESR